MRQLSEDGQWWWDGRAWVPTAQVVVPQIPPTQLEQSGRVAAARGRLGRYGPSYIGTDSILLSALVLPLHRRAEEAMRVYRAWTIEQLASATAYLLGTDEPMVAGETALLEPQSLTGSWKRDLAVAVTAAHVLVFRMDSFDGQPRWIALAARATEVTMEVRSAVSAMFRGGPALTVRGTNGEWVVQGSARVFNPGPVVEAWHQAAKTRDRESRTGG